MTTTPSTIRIDGRIETEPGGGLWLIKWLLLIPHLIVLALLWLAFPVLTVIAMIAILFTARYPRWIFDFNLGVLRWTWRVSFYGYGALGTDRYPPFSLGAEPDYPATLDVPYPERLSRGLALVKWWLLALPHYFISAFFVGGGFLTWNPQPGTWSLVVMNADAAPGLRAGLDVGATIPALRPVEIGLLAAAAVLLGGGAVLLAAAARPRSPSAASTVDNMR